MVSKVTLSAVIFICIVISASARRIYDDLEVAASDKGKEEWQKKGGGNDHEKNEESKKGEKGEKGYKGAHEYSKGDKGHHDKEGHKGEYEDEKGHKKKHHDDSDYFHEAKKGDKGEKGHKYEEKGSFSKGHSTKGHHEIHKLDEFKKDKKFFDEDGEEGFDEKYGDFHEEHAHKKGGSHKKGHKKGAHEHGHHGKFG